MRYMVLILLILASTLNAQPWNNPSRTSRMHWEEHDLPEITFEIEAHAHSSVHGRSFQELFEFDAELAKFREDILPKLSVGTATTHDIRPAMRLLGSIDDLDQFPDDGIVTKVSYGFSTGVRNIALDRDAITLGMQGYTASALSNTLSFDSFFGYSLIDRPSHLWLQDLETMVYIVGRQRPQTVNGKNLADALMAGGYPPHIAETLATLAEEEGIKSGNVSGDLFIDLLLNTLYQGGPSLQDNPDPLHDNQSAAMTSHVQWRSFSLGYSAGITDWFTVGFDARYFQASIDQRKSRLLSYTGGKYGAALSKGFERSYAPKDYEEAWGIDLGLTFSPPQKILENLAIGFYGRNINEPSFEFPQGTLTIPAQYSVEVDWSVFSGRLPFRAHFGMDLNRVESLVLPEYHTQDLSFGLSFQPTWVGVGPIVDISMYKNVGDNDPWLLSMTVGLHLWYVDILAGGAWDFQMESLRGQAVPHRLNAWAKIQASIPIG